jgi:hypothetical protein
MMAAELMDPVFPVLAIGGVIAVVIGLVRRAGSRRPRLAILGLTALIVGLVGPHGQAIGQRGWRGAVPHVVLVWAAPMVQGHHSVPGRPQEGMCTGLCRELRERVKRHELPDWAMRRLVRRIMDDPDHERVLPITDALAEPVLSFYGELLFWAEIDGFVTPEQLAELERRSSVEIRPVEPWPPDVPVRAIVRARHWRRQPMRVTFLDAADREIAQVAQLVADSGAGALNGGSEQAGATRLPAAWEDPMVALGPCEDGAVAARCVVERLAGSPWRPGATWDQIDRREIEVAVDVQPWDAVRKRPECDQRIENEFAEMQIRAAVDDSGRTVALLDLLDVWAMMREHRPMTLAVRVEAVRDDVVVATGRAWWTSAPRSETGWFAGQRLSRGAGLACGIFAHSMDYAEVAVVMEPTGAGGFDADGAGGDEPLAWRVVPDPVLALCDPETDAYWARCE